jgi:hypothetical protein
MYYIKLAGSDTLLTPDSNCEVNYSTVEALADVSIILLECYGVYLDIENEGEEVIGLGGAVNYLRQDRQKLNLPLKEVDILDYPTLLSDLKTVFAKQYHYIYPDYTNAYASPYSITSSGKAKVVTGITKEETESIGRMKKFSLNFKMRLPNG